MNNELRKRRKLLSVPEDLVLQLSIVRAETITDKLELVEPLPKTAQIISVHTDFSTGSFVYVIVDESWPIVPEGSRPMYLHYTIRRAGT